MNTSQILFKAAQILERDGWCKGISLNSSGQMCAGGAIARAHHGDADHWDAASEETMRDFMRIIDGSAPEYPTSRISAWNNAAERTAEEVIDALVIASIEAKA